MSFKWHEETYRKLHAENANDLQCIEALEALLNEQYVEFYMTEYAALCLRAGKENEARRMLRKQLRLFSGGEWEDTAQRLMEEGACCAQTVLEELESHRPGLAVCDTPQASAPVPPVQETAPEAGPADVPEPVEQCFEKIVGMEKARRVLTELYTSVQYQAVRSGYSLKTQAHYHFLLRGETGVGKSLLADRLSGFLHRLGASSDAEACVIDGYQLPELLGTDGSGLSDALQGKEGRTVIVDGLGDLFADTGGNDLPRLLRVVLERKGEQNNFILTGRSEDVDHLLTVEPSLMGMFLYDISLPAYSLEELVEMAVIIARSRGYTLSTAARTALAQRLENELRSPVFQWGKSLETILSKASLRLAERISQSTTISKGNLMRIEPRDLEGDSGEPTFDQLMARLDALIGLTAVKLVVHDLAVQARINREAQRQKVRGADFGTLHMVFRGGAGTGKTTVARIIGGIYKSLGILPQGDKLIECTRADLVAEYSGQTAPKVKAKVKQALGGVLFIDEAYSLCQDNDPFGQEAIDTLVAEIENHRGNLMVILAGYPQDMDKLLARNEGLASRFPTSLEFADYTQSELEDIFRGMLKGAGKALGEGCREQLSAYIAENRGKWGFGNARGVRNLTQRLLNAQTLRLDRLWAEKGELEPEDFALILPEDITALLEKDSKAESLEELLAQLDALVGLDSVKEEVKKQVSRIKGLQRLEEATGRSLQDKRPALHMVLRGNPGTGKTTAARLIAKIYNALGLLPDGDIFLECGREELVAGYVGQTAPKVREVAKRAMGGVLFIDEAYSLCKDPDSDSFGKEAIDTLIAIMENERDKLMVILAGYSGDMDQLLKVNPGLKSRVPTTLTFEDYTPDELTEIFRRSMEARGYTVDEGVLMAVKKRMEQESRFPDFGNARGVRNIAEAVESRFLARIGEEAALDPDMERGILKLCAQDVTPAAEEEKTPAETVEELLAQLNGLIGLHAVKVQVNKMVRALGAQQAMREKGIELPDDQGTLHMLFEGNAGTGKTTVARLIARIYGALGLLPRGDIFVECGRTDLVASYVGQTAPKTRDVVQRALGGVLFIDEAYSLVKPDNTNDFGPEAVETLLAEMENHRRDFMVILAGYSDKMDQFFRANQGLASRVPTKLTFEDYTRDELFQIFQSMIGKTFTLREDAALAARELIARESQTEDFGNARGVRNIAERVILTHKSRMGELLAQGIQLSKEEYLTITPADLGIEPADKEVQDHAGVV